MLCKILRFHCDDYDGKRREREREVGGSEKHYNGWEGKDLSPGLKIPIQCPLMLLIGVKHLTGII
jgi:hypothetical protein